MNIQEAKERLKNEGYTSFELIDFDKDFYDIYDRPVAPNKQSRRSPRVRIPVRPKSFKC